jgi:hypothetical protein
MGGCSSPGKDSGVRKNRNAVQVVGKHEIARLERVNAWYAVKCCCLLFGGMRERCARAERPLLSESGTRRGASNTPTRGHAPRSTCRQGSSAWVPTSFTRAPGGELTVCNRRDIPTYLRFLQRHNKQPHRLHAHVCHGFAQNRCVRTKDKSGHRHGQSDANRGPIQHLTCSAIVSSPQTTINPCPDD